MLKINLKSPTPIYEQLVSGIKRLIDANELREGDSLPTIRSLSSQLDVAVNTVARAYQELEAQKVVESHGRKGTFVKTDNENSANEDKKIFKDPIRRLLQKGLNKKEIEEIFEDNLTMFFD